MSVEELVKELERLAGDIQELRSQVGRDCKQPSTEARVQAGVLIDMARTTGGIRYLEQCHRYLNKTESELDLAHDALRRATEEVDSYLGNHFGISGGSSGDVAPDRSPEANKHLDSFSRDQKRAKRKKVLLIACTGIPAAATVGAFAGALLAGAPLFVALSASGAAGANLALVQTVELLTTAVGVGRVGIEYRDAWESGVPPEELGKRSLMARDQIVLAMLPLIPVLAPLGVLFAFRDLIEALRELGVFKFKNGERSPDGE